MKNFSINNSILDSRLRGNDKEKIGNNKEKLCCNKEKLWGNNKFWE